MASQETIRQCWMNAFESTEDYPVEVRSTTEAVALRAQCHKWRRTQALAFNPLNPESYFLYSLEIKFENRGERIFVTFVKSRGINLPPPTGRAARVLQCVIRRDGGFVVEAHTIPIQVAGFVSGHDTMEEALQAIENLKALEAPPPERKSIFTPEMVEAMMKDEAK